MIAFTSIVVRARFGVLHAVSGAALVLAACQPTAGNGASGSGFYSPPETTADANQGDPNAPSSSADAAALDPSTAAGGEGESVATGGAPEAGACGDVPVSGICDGNSVRRCIVPTGYGQPKVVSEKCQDSEVCTQASGHAVCQLQGDCAEGAVACDSSGANLNVCTPQGTWQAQACPNGCKSSPVGSFCKPEFATADYTANFAYEFRVPNAAWTDWSAAPSSAPLIGALALTVRGGPDGSQFQVIDAVATDATGLAAIQVPAELQPGDILLIIAGKVSDDGSQWEYMIAQPEIGDGEQPTDATCQGPVTATPWLWTVDLGKYPNGSQLTITEAAGSGVARVFDYLRYVHAVSKQFFAGPSKSVVAWMRPNTSWDCGVCFAAAPGKLASGLQFDSQLWVPMTAQNTSFWSDPVTAHELGHWTMSTFSTSPNEGGPHCIGVPTFPGQAWSEGWATGFATLIRNQPVYYDKQAGAFFWVDIGKRQYKNQIWQLPSAKVGLIQYHDENDVAAIVWQLGQQPQIGVKAVMAALSSPRLLGAPSLRGYTRRTWQVENCQKSGAVDTAQPAPFLADYLDALRCGGVPASAIDAVTFPNVYYPYPSNAPLCEGQ